MNPVTRAAMTQTIHEVGSMVKMFQSAVMIWPDASTC